jgi:hypothetical protein
LASVGVAVLASVGGYLYVNKSDKQDAQDATSGDLSAEVKKPSEDEAAKNPSYATADLTEKLEMMDGPIETDTILNLPRTDSKEKIAKAIEKQKEISFRANIFPPQHWVDPATGDKHTWQVAKRFPAWKPYAIYPTNHTIYHSINGKVVKEDIKHNVSKKKMAKIWENTVPSQAQEAGVRLPDLSEGKSKGLAI